MISLYGSTDNAPRACSASPRDFRGQVPGPNLIEIAAEDESGKFSSEGLSVLVVSDVVAAKPPALHIVTILSSALSSNDLADTFSKEFKERSANLFENVIEDKFQFEPGNRTSISNFVDELSRRIAPQDTAIMLVRSLTSDTGIVSASTTGLLGELLDSLSDRLPIQKLFFIGDFVQLDALRGGDERGVSTAATLDRLTNEVGRASVFAISTGGESEINVSSVTRLVLKCLQEPNSESSENIGAVSLITCIERESNMNTGVFNHEKTLVRAQISGADFPIARRLNIGPSPSARDITATHVVIKLACLRIEGRTDCADNLPAGFPVHVVSIRDDEALVSRDGRDLGYVKSALLSRLQ
jgi:hypothetical protein